MKSSITDMALLPQETTGSARVIVVLGMHRSGTSALTKGLNALGVSLSENLMPEGEFNPKGHWEDLDIVAINEKLLSHLSLSWFSPTRVVWEAEDPFINVLLGEAVTLVRQRLNQYELWGFKDPRTSFVLPFWMEVFKRAGVKPEWIFIHRNPLDICRSLEKRDGFSHRHSYLLWLLHTADQLKHLVSESVLWLTFSQLTTQPEKTVSRVASFLSVSLEDCSEVETFCHDFIDPTLNHSLTTTSDLYKDETCFAPVVAYHQLFEALANLQHTLEFEQFQDLSPQLDKVLIEQKELWVEERNQAFFYERDALKAKLYCAELRSEQIAEDARNHQVEFNVEIHALQDELTDTHGQLVDALERSSETSEKLETVTGELAAVTGELETVTGELETVTGELETVTGELAAVKGELATVTGELAAVTGELATVTERSVQLHDVLVSTQTELFDERDTKIQLAEALHAVYASTSWKLTLPLRRTKEMVQQALLVPEFICQYGGIVSLTKKVLRVVRQKGMKGLFYKVKSEVLIKARTAALTPAALTKEKTEVLAKAKTEALIDYGTWLSRYGNVSDEHYQAMQKRIGSLNHPPLISVLMPVYNAPRAYLIEAIQSVREQVYPHWQLCLADDASTDPEVLDVLYEFVEKDTRIQLVKRQENGHISRTTNSALEIAEGDFIALMDHDDKLSPDALFWVAEAILAHDDVAMIYSDEDKIKADDGMRYDPNFKSRWNPTLFLSQNYVSHLGVYRTDIAKAIGGFTVGLEGAQDWDFTLRFVERIDPVQIVHIPRILYHWRAIEGSTAIAGDEKPYALIAGMKAVEMHLARQGRPAFVTQHPERHYVRVQYQIPDPAPLVSIIIPTRNGLDVLSVCIDSLLEKTTYPNFEVIIVDNGSDCEETLAYLHKLPIEEPRIRVIRDDSPFNYSALNNKAVAASAGELITLLNNDIKVISPDWLTEMVGYAIQPENGAVGARLWYPDDTLQHGGVVLVGGVAGHAHKYLPRGFPGYSCRAIVAQNFSAVTAACLVIRKEIFDEVSGLNEKDLSVAFNDVDFCLRVQEAGYFNVWTPYAELYHYESKTRGFEDTPEKIARFQKEVEYMQNRWGTLLLDDPCYNPNLTLDREDFSLAEIPRV